MSNWKVGPGGRLYHPTTGAYVGQLDDNGNEQMVVSSFPSDGGLGKSPIAIPGTGYLSVDDLLPSQAGTVAWSGPLLYGLTFTAAARAPQSKTPRADGLEIVAPVNTDGSTNQYYEMVLPDLPSARVSPRSVSLRVYSDDWSAVDQISVYFGASGLAKFYLATWSGTANGQSFGAGVAGNAGWRTLWKARADCIAQGAVDFTTADFVSQKFRVYSVLGSAAALKFGELRYDADDIPTIAIDFDDAHRTVYSDALPILDALGIKATIAVIPDKVGTTNFMTWAQLRDWESRGHACCTHGVRGALDSLTDYATVAEAVADAVWSRSQLLVNGVGVAGAADYYVFPQGEYNWGGTYKSRELTQALLDAGFTSGRSTAFPQFFNARMMGSSAAQRMIVPIIGHTWSSSDEAANINTISGRIDACANYRYSGRLMFHYIATTPSVGTEISPANLTTLLNRCAYWATRGMLRIVLSHKQLWLPPA